MIAAAPRSQPAPAAAPMQATVLDPVSGVAIGGTVTAEISESHVSFRADDGLIWAVPKDLVEYAGGAR